MPIVCEPDPAVAGDLNNALGGQVRLVPDTGSLSRALQTDPTEMLVVIGPGVSPEHALETMARLREERPVLGCVLVRDELDVQTLSEAMRAGAREVVQVDDMTGVVNACRRSWQVSQRLQGSTQPPPGYQASQPETATGKVVIVFGAKGGIGKSMLSTNLAVSLANDGNLRTCLVDLDLAFGDVAIMLRIDPKRTLVDAVGMASHMDEQGVASLLTGHDSGLKTVLAPIAPGDAERINAQLITELLTVLKRMFDFIVIDTPSQFSEHVLAAFDIADHQVLLATPEVPSLKNLRVTLDMLDMLGYAQEKRSVVLNRADAKAGLTAEDIDRAIGRAVAVQIPSSPDVPAHINRGTPIVQENFQHPVSRAIRQLIATRIVGLRPIDQQQRPQEQKRGLFRSRSR